MWRFSTVSRIVGLVALALACVLADVRLHPHPSSDYPTNDERRPYSTDVRFEPNLGQFPNAVRFVGHDGRGGSLLVTDATATFLHHGISDGEPCTARLEMTFDRALSPPEAWGRLTSRSNFFVGSDPARWRTSVPNFAGVSLRGAAGERVDFHGSESGELEYDVRLPPKVDVSDVTVRIADGSLELREGDLVARTRCGSFIQKRPRAFEGNQERDVRFVEKGPGRFGFVVDRRGDGAITIDPTVVYAMSIPGTSSPAKVALDGSGGLYVVTTTQSTAFPVASALQPAFAGVYDVAILKLAANGSSLMWATYLGGAGADNVTGLAVSPTGDLYVVGGTTSVDFPLVNALKNTRTAPTQGFVTKLSKNGDALAYSTYVGGSTYDLVTGAAVNGLGELTIGGATRDTDFPITAGAGQGVFAGGQFDGFLMKLSADGSTTLFATYFGGSSDDGVTAVALGPDGSASAVGYTTSPNLPTRNPFQATFGGQIDDFVLRVPQSGVGIDYASYLGGSGVEWDGAIVVDPGGNAIVTGATESQNFPVQGGLGTPLSGSRDAFVTKVSMSGGLVASTLFGGANTEFAWNLALRDDGEVVVVGETSSADFPLVSSLQLSVHGSSDAFVTRFNSSLTAITGSTVFGGSMNDSATGVTVDSQRSLYVVGTSNPGVPVKNSLFGPSQLGVWVAKFAPMSLSPPEGTVPPRGTISFTTTDAASAVVYSLATNGSGGTIVPATGVYTAGATGSTTDVIQVMDGSGLTSTAQIDVGPGVSIVPTSPTTPPKSSLALAAVGGSGTGFTWSLPSNNSGGSINASTGAYVAGGTPNVTDVVWVTDSLGNTASTSVKVGNGVTIAPTSAAVPPKGAVAFSASGGTGTGFVWSLAPNVSGGTVAPTGSYQAGATANVVDGVHVIDSVGNAASVNVSVGGGLAINPANPSTPPRATIAFVGTGGSGVYSWSLLTNGSGGSIQPSTAVYTAGAKGGSNDVVELSDDLGNSATVSVSIGPAISITPAVAKIATTTNVQFFAVGGLGHDYTWSLGKNGSGGSIDPVTGDYRSGPVGGSNDQIRVRDVLGNDAELVVMVGGGATPTPPADGCSCSTTGGRNETTSALLASVGAIAALVARRRRARQPGKARMSGSRRRV